MSSPFAVRTVSSHAQLAAAQRRSSRLRWTAVLAIVGGAHLIAALWFERHHETFKPVAPEHVPVQVALLKPERIETQAAGSPPPAVAKPAPPKHGAQPPREHVLTATRPEPSKATTTKEASAPVGASAASDSVAASAEAAQAAAANTGPGTGEGNAPHSTPGVKFSVPPSGDLQYDTFYNGVRNQPGTIHWTSDGHSYDMVVSVPLPFVGTFSYSSHGHVDAFGLAPDQYVEKRGRRGEDVTTFDRDTKQIGFTRTPATLALPDGAQDRFSMVMQLASLVRGDPDAYQPGVTRQFYVTDNDSGEIWPIETIGDETVRTEQGSVDARHFMRLPRRENDRRRIDVWLAPSLGWLPARLVQTEPNGTQIELVWRGKLAPPDVNDTSSSDDTSPGSAQPSVTDPGAGPEKP